MLREKLLSLGGWPTFAPNILDVSTSNRVGAPSFAAFAKGGNRRIPHPFLTGNYHIGMAIPVEVQQKLESIRLRKGGSEKYQNGADDRT